MSTLHVHLDEAGNFTFSPKGSRYYIFAAAWTYDPEPLAHELTRLRFRLLKEGETLQSFHAAPDKQRIRDLVVERMVADGNWRFAGLLVEKPKVNPSIREPEKFYPKFTGSLLKFLFRGCVERGTSRVQVFTDTIPVQKNRQGIEKSIKTICKRECGGVPFSSLHHKRESNYWLQVADYCCWGLQRKWEHGDPRTYDQLKSCLEAEELDALREGTTLYY